MAKKMQAQSQFDVEALAIMKVEDPEKYAQANAILGGTLDGMIESFVQLKHQAEIAQNQKFVSAIARRIFAPYAPTNEAERVLRATVLREMKNAARFKDVREELYAYAQEGIRLFAAISEDAHATIKEDIESGIVQPAKSKAREDAE